MAYLTERNEGIVLLMDDGTELLVVGLYDEDGDETLTIGDALSCVGETEAGDFVVVEFSEHKPATLH